MKTSNRLVVAALAALAAFGTVSGAQARGPHGGPWEMMGGPGGPGGGPGFGPCGEREKPLTEAQVKDIVEGMIAWRGEDAKVGAVKTVDDGKIVAEVVGADGKVLRAIAFDAKTGRPERPEPPKK